MESDYQRIEQAIRYLEDHFQEQPSLDDLAAHLNLSPYHLQRLFRRWAGISPKRFLQVLTVEHAKQLLAETGSILDATYESGLSSPGRLHDLFVSVEAVTPGEFKHQGAGATIWYGIHTTPFGPCLLAATERGICELSFVGKSEQETAVDTLRRRWPEADVQADNTRTAALLNQVFPPVGSNGQRAVSLLLQGTNFQVKVWQALLRIPPGYVGSYEDVARLIGQPGAARAVGSAVAANPVAYVIPCHRVIQKRGLVGDYHWGQTRKKAILAWEAAQKA